MAQEEYGGRLNSFTLLAWLLAAVAYLYSENNVYSVLFSLILLGLLWIRGTLIRWRGLFYGTVVSCIFFTFFYGFFLRQGETIIFSVGGNIPFLSGPVTAESIIQGMLLGATVTLALFYFSLFSEFFVRKNSRLYMPGILRNISILFSFLSYIVSVLFRHQELFERKCKNRNLSIPWKNRIHLFMHDASFYAFEKSFSMFEAIESRGFSRSKIENPSKNVFFISLVLFLIFLIIFRISHEMLWVVPIFISFLVATAALIRDLYFSPVAALNIRSIHFSDVIILLYSGSLIILFFSDSWLTDSKSIFEFNWKTHLLFTEHGLLFLLTMSTKNDD